MPRLPQRPRRFDAATLFFMLVLCLWLSALPPDAPVRLALSFNYARFLIRLGRAAGDREAWLRNPPRHPVDLRSDVGYLIKTGYGTRDRLPEQLDALAAGRGGSGLLGDEGRSFLVIGDWTTVNETEANLMGVRVHDAVKMVIENNIAASQVEHPRLTKYRSLQAAVAAGDEKAQELGKRYGWELDALKVSEHEVAMPSPYPSGIVADGEAHKFIMGLEFAHQRLPQKKWYMVLDDDTFVVKSSLELLLSHLDPSKPHYIGNAVGDYKGRFAHGGSAVLLSGAAMRRLFGRPDVVADAYVASLDETWGDRLVATTLQRVGVYLDERYSHYFNGESPRTTRIRQDRLCSPIVSFHNVRGRGAMSEVRRALAAKREPVLWGQLWDLFSEQPMAQFVQKRSATGDHVGSKDERVRSWKVSRRVDACKKKCDKRGAQCLAWSFVASTKTCHGSPWLIIGEDHARDSVSGISWEQIRPLLSQCKPFG